MEDLETWLLENVPGSNLATLQHLEQLPNAMKALDFGQSILFLAATIVNPIKLFSYPLWRKSGRVTVELQNELIRAFQPAHDELIDVEKLSDNELNHLATYYEKVRAECDRRHPVQHKIA